MENDLILSLDKISESLKKLEIYTKNISDFTNQILKLNETCLALSKTTSELDSASILEFLNSFNTIMSVVNNLAYLNETVFKFKDTGGMLENVFSTLTTTATSASVATGGFSAALSFLSSTPILMVVGGLLTLSTALIAFNYEESDSIKQSREFSEALHEKRKSLEETEETIKKNIQSSIENAKSAETQSAALRVFVDNLRGLADENGYIKNFEEAQYYVDKINSAMPNTVKLTESGRLEWIKNSQAIEDNIKKLEQKAKTEAYYDGFVESLKNEAKLRADLVTAQANYNAELEKQRICKEKIDELESKWRKDADLIGADRESLNKYYEEFEYSKVHLSEYAEILESATNSYENNRKGQQLWREALTASDEKIIASAILMSDEYTNIEEKGTSSWGNLAGAAEDCKNRMTTANEEELQTIQLTSGALEASMVHKALVYGMSYDQMIQKLKDSGLQMSEEEEKRLQNSYNAWKMSSDEIQKVQSTGLDALKLMKVTALSEMSLSDQKMLSQSVIDFANSGSQEGLQLCEKLSESLQQNNGKIDKDTQQIIDIITNGLDSVDPKVIAKLIGPSESEITNATNKFDRVPKNVYTTWQIRGGEGEITYKFNPKYRACGGFPETGELFVAREAGPELVGRINGKTAVANNDQIVSGISSGVYNAVRSAMQGKGGNGNMNIHATFVMDGEVVGKQVIKYHNGVVKRTGTTPLMI
ncbi:hypothetical protein [Candidatus Stoquefichus massiliensis]|uniref:hypothetical protein n=1 Tax=Candidatus Stoquefichus massiliensis TaxID=1470350 RepID=UPI00048198F8|nr:hypothetical protein [Candidatus Stoquefichus massiliensis]